MLNIKNFVNKSVTEITEVDIQAAIDHCSIEGGGTVYLGKGIYDCGTIELKKDVHLFLGKGAVVKFTADRSRWRRISKEANLTNADSFINCEYDGRPENVFFYASNADNIGILGEGVIDGSEEIFYGEIDQYHIEGSYYPRVPVILFENCNHLTVRDITLQRSAFWTVHLAGCQDVEISSIRILNNRKMANCDGINPDHCQDVRITNCYIESGDDSIVLKGTEAYREYGSTKNVLIDNCILSSTSSAIKIGTESVSDFINIQVRNCIIKESNRGIALQLRDEGNLQNISFDGITIETRCFSEKWWGNGEPIYVTAFDRKSGMSVGHIEDIAFRNITCTSPNGVIVAAERDGLIGEVTFDNVKVTITDTSKWRPDGFDYRPSTLSVYKSVGQPEDIHLRNVKGVHFSNSKFAIKPDMQDIIVNTSQELVEA